MQCRLTDLAEKEVVNVCNGCRIGFVGDVEVDTCTSKVCALIVLGRAKCFGLLGREEDIIIRWCDIEIIGEDIILVRCDIPRRRHKKRSFLDNLMGNH